MRQEEVVNAIRKKCKNVETLSLKRWRFTYNRQWYFYMADKHDGMLRFCVPHLIKASDYDEKRLVEVINETNREVKYVKAVLLNCGSVSLNYDHKISSDETVENIVPHIIRALDFASNYLFDKLNRKKEK